MSAPRILIVSFYFQPDLSAGSFRTTSLVAALRAAAPPGAEIAVVTTLPNRYHSYVKSADKVERDGNVSIARFALPAHRSDFAGQARAFLSFARQVRRYVRGRQYDVVFATSSRLMTAALGAWVARGKRAPLYLDIRDIFVETIGDILPRIMAWPVRVVFSLVERWTIGSATRVNLVSRGFEPYFARRYPRQEFSWFTNGVDEEFVVAQAGRPRAPSDDPRALVIYAGNLGESQALHHVLPGLALELASRARFMVIGDGGRRTQLEQALAAAGTDNVEMRPPLPRAELVDLYRAADVLFLHLGNQPAFERVLPSKLFEYAALGKPVLAGVGGYAAQFVREEISNAAVFPPCDFAAGAREFDSLIIRDAPRAEFIVKYRRSNIAARLADEILALADLRAERRR